MSITAFSSALWAIGGLAIVYAVSVVALFKRQKARRRLQPPERLEVLRGPGESLRRKMDELAEKAVLMVFVGAFGTPLVFIGPVLVARWRPEADHRWLIGSGLVLAIAVGIASIARGKAVMMQRWHARLGWLGECEVAEHLQACVAKGCHVFHDVPIQINGHAANIDHIAVGLGGAVVIETKMRSKPADRDKEKIEVCFDGERISWPRFPNDTKTLWQVKENARWLERYLCDQCGITVPVLQVVAIPGWSVRERVLTEPRVVSAKGVSDAVVRAIASDKPALLSNQQLGDIRKALDKLCRDVTM